MNYLTNWDEVPLIIDTKIMTKLLGLEIKKVREMFHSRGFPRVQGTSKMLVEKEALIEYLRKGGLRK